MNTISLNPPTDPARLRRRSPEDPSPLSFGQYRLWFLDQLTPGSSAYNITDQARIHGPLNLAAFRAALDAIVGRHEVLRTIFVAPRGVPLPVVANSRSVDFKFVDLTNLPATRRESRLDELLRKEAARPFDLSTDVMLRAVLFRMADAEHLFFHNSHHIAWDLRSKFVFYQELSKFYRAFSSGGAVRLPALPLQYSDYARWERARLQGEFLDKLVFYWKAQLSGAALRLGIPTDLPRPAVLTYRGGPRVPIVLDTQLLSELESFLPPGGLPISKALLWTGISPFHVLLAAFNVLMYAYSGQSDILVSSPYGNRESPELENLIGFFPNTMILRSHVSDDLTFSELATRALDTVHAAVLHAALPFDKIVESACPVRRAGQLPLVQVNFRIQRTPLPMLELHELSVDLPEWVDNGASKFDLALELVTTPSLRGYFEYSADLFKETTVRQMAFDFGSLLREMLCRRAVPLGALPLFRKVWRPADR
jgi:Condensation domain